MSFRALDADHDGGLTAAEAGPNRLLADRFAAADINRDGVLSALEFNHAALELSAEQQDESSPVSGTLGITAVEQSGRVVISRVGRGTPAAAAGLQPGDIVLRYEGEPIVRPRDLYRRIVDSVPGSVVELEIRRNGEPRRIQVRVEQVDVTPRVGGEALEQVKRAATGVIGGVKVVAKAPFEKAKAPPGKPQRG